MNATDERSQVMLGRAGSWKDDGLIDEAKVRAIESRFAHPWRSHGLLLQLVFFVLTCVALGASYAFLETIDVPKPGLVLAPLAVAAAEVLIRKLKWFGTGVEAGLWLGGMVALISELPRTGTPESLLVIAAAVAVAGWRVRQPLFGIAAVCFVVWYAERRFDLGVVVALAFGTAGMALLARSWKRPSTEWLCSGLVLVMPFAARAAADPRWRVATIIMFTAYGVAALALALDRRHHAYFAAGAAALAIAAVDLSERMAAPLEVKLGVAGALLLLLAWLVARVLRGRTTGLVVTESKLTPFDAAIEIGATLGAQPHAARPAAGGRPQGDGGFGGAGATGDY